HGTQRPVLYTLSLHDALPIFAGKRVVVTGGTSGIGAATSRRFLEEGAHVVSIALAREEPINGLTAALEADVADPDEVADAFQARSEEHTFELQSRRDLVCRLL